MCEWAMPLVVTFKDEITNQDVYQGVFKSLHTRL